MDRQQAMTDVERAASAFGLIQLGLVMFGTLGLAAKSGEPVCEALDRAEELVKTLIPPSEPDNDLCRMRRRVGQAIIDYLRDL